MLQLQNENEPWSLCLKDVSLPCSDQKRCYLQELRCDGRMACADGSDEWNCQNFTCSPEKVKCGDNIVCIWWDWICDGVEQCPDASDEARCSEFQQSAKKRSRRLSQQEFHHLRERLPTRQHSA
ncbi:PREDICTED: low-density lipoprotein receptor-like [Priapulus caudatus]|uniref:Low-density lipoprotein receptor-like n=1 Tax=Priapulus caudatus TaxID=37621 RepID=A0ABM1E252_PRICU|nr:PREDICTED: low-density lipoprotein receptor-like [Priapulus caudatus]